jgi:hypothetical protein
MSVGQIRCGLRQPGWARSAVARGTAEADVVVIGSKRRRTRRALSSFVAGRSAEYHRGNGAVYDIAHREAGLYA